MLGLSNLGSNILQSERHYDSAKYSMEFLSWGVQFWISFMAKVNIILFLEINIEVGLQILVTIYEKK